MTDSKCKKQLILVVDDNQEFREFGKYLVEASCDDCEVVTVEDGSKALEAVKETTFDLIITDTNMPNLHGPGFVKGARELGLDTPIILLYSDSIQIGELDQTEVFDCGATLILSKTDFADFYQKIFFRYLESSE